MTRKCEIIEQYWTYDMEYEEDGVLRYISNITECGLDFDIQNDTVDIYRFFTYYDEISFDEEESSDKYTKILEKAFEIFLDNNTEQKCETHYDGDPMCSGGNDLVGFFEVPCEKQYIETFIKLNEKFNRRFNSVDNILTYIVENYNEEIKHLKRHGYDSGSGIFIGMKKKHVKRYLLFMLEENIFLQNKLKTLLLVRKIYLLN